MKRCMLCLFNEKEQYIKNSLFWVVDEPRDFTFPGLYFIRLKRHCEALSELNTGESKEIGELIQKYSLKSYEKSRAQRVIAMSLGLSEPHIHFWILPKTSENKNDVLEIQKAMQTILKRYKNSLF